MIRFVLQCHRAHSFEGWFRNSADFDTQNNHGSLVCPICASTQIEKALMTPALSSAKGKTPLAGGRVAGNRLVNQQKQLFDKIRAWTRKMTHNTDYVGSNFAEEARKIHFGEVAPHAIHGEATMDEVVALLDDDIDIIPLPSLPEDKH